MNDPYPLRPRFAFCDREGDTKLAATMREIQSLLASISQDAWSKTHDGEEEILFSATSDETRAFDLQFSLSKESETLPFHDFDLQINYEAHSPEKARSLTFGKIEIHKALDCIEGQDLSNAIQRLTIIDHEEIDGISGFEKPKDNCSAFQRMWQPLIAVFASAIFKEPDKSSEYLSGTYNGQEQKWELVASNDIDDRHYDILDDHPTMAIIPFYQTISRNEEYAEIFIYPREIHGDLHCPIDPLDPMKYIAAFQGLERRHSHKSEAE